MLFARLVSVVKAALAGSTCKRKLDFTVPQRLQVDTGSRGRAVRGGQQLHAGVGRGQVLSWDLMGEGVEHGISAQGAGGLNYFEGRV